MSARRKPAFRWLKRSFSLTGIVVILALALPFAVPLDHYIPELQKLASEQLREPVTIGSLHVALVPAPGVVLRHVRVGKRPDASIDSLRIGIDLRSLFRPVKILNRVDLSGVRLRTEGLEKFPLWFKIDSPQHVDIRSVRIHRLHLVLPKLVLGPLEADVQLTPQADFKNALITGDGGKLRIAVKPEAKRYRLNVRATHWKPPYGPPLLFDKVSANILAGADKMSLQTVSGTFYQGSFTGTAELDWEHDWKLKGDITTHGIQVTPLLKLFTDKVSASGGMDAQASFSARAYAAENLFNNIKLSATFNIQHGTLYRVDLAKAARSLSREGVRGGDTRFDDISGKLDLAGNEYRFTDLHVTSGLLNGSGNVDVAADKTVTGNINVALRGSAGLLNAPLEVVGTLDDPVMRLKRSALAGAAIGTAVLGPGLGTTLGIKASELAEKLGDMLKGGAPDKKADTK